MNNFQYQNPTRIFFGVDQYEKLTSEIPIDTKILMIYGGGSIKTNGVYDAVRNALNSHKLIEFGGVLANPEYEHLLEALEIIKKENITYLLAVGGGSVIDATKFLAGAALYKGEYPWDILAKRIRVTEAIPFASVLTLPATASEMNSGAVISRKATKEKLTMGGPALFPQFSILDPSVVKTVPKRQIANGITDAFTHVLEQYMTFPVDAALTDRFSESIMQTLIETAPKVMKDPSDYKAAANFMWSCTMALNGLIQLGVPSDWAVHMIGHELTALFGIDHARTLAIIAPSHYRFNIDDKLEKLVQYGERVWGITEGTPKEKAEKAIAKTEDFFHSLEIDTKLSNYTKDFEGTAKEIKNRFNDRKWLGLGEKQKLTPDDVEKIVVMAY